MDAGFIRAPPLAAYWERCIVTLGHRNSERICNNISGLQCMEVFVIVEILHQWPQLKHDLSGKPFFVLPYRQFWEHVSVHHGNFWGYSMVLTPIRVSPLILADTSCNERGIAEYNRIHTASRFLMSQMFSTYSQSNTTAQSPCMNLIPRICTIDDCALSSREIVLRRVPNGETWR
jgi:hypothetical protein